MTNPSLTTDTRIFWLTATEARPLPPTEPKQLKVIMTRSLSLPLRDGSYYNGQVRPHRMDVTIDVTHHKALRSKRDGEFRPLMRVIDSEATWDDGLNRVQLGGGFIEVLCEDLRSFGLGSLFMNAAIGWAMHYHADATLRAIKVTDDKYADRRKAFYCAFGFAFGRRRNATGSYLSEPMSVKDLRMRAHPMLDSEWNLTRRSGREYDE